MYFHKAVCTSVAFCSISLMFAVTTIKRKEKQCVLWYLNRIAKSVQRKMRQFGFQASYTREESGVSERSNVVIKQGKAMFMHNSAAIIPRKQRINDCILVLLPLQGIRHTFLDIRHAHEIMVTQQS